MFGFRCERMYRCILLWPYMPTSSFKSICLRMRWWLYRSRSQMYSNRYNASKTFLLYNIHQTSPSSPDRFFLSSFVDENATFIQPQAKSDFSSSKYITCKYKTLFPLTLRLPFIILIKKYDELIIATDNTLSWIVDPNSGLSKGGIVAIAVVSVIVFILVIISAMFLFTR